MLKFNESQANILLGVKYPIGINNNNIQKIKIKDLNNFLTNKKIVAFSFYDPQNEKNIICWNRIETLSMTDIEECFTNSYILNLQIAPQNIKK